MRNWMAITTALVGALPGVAAAQDNPLTIHASVRVRGEALSGEPRVGLGADDSALFLRTRVEAIYDAGAFSLGGEIVDARAYGEPRRSATSANEVDALEPVQAWIAVPLGGGASVKAGRFLLDLGSNRLVTDEIFRNTTNGFTGVRGDWANRAGDKATLFWSMPQQRLPGDVDALRDNRVELDKERIAFQFFGATATKAGVLGGTLEAYAYRLAERDAPGFATRDRRLWTPGLRLFRAPGKGMDHDLEIAWQRGTTRLTTAAIDRDDRRVSAALVHATLGTTAPGALSPRLGVAFDYASGDGTGRDYGRFDTLFGARAFEFGPTGLFGAVARANLVSLEARASIERAKRWDMLVAVRPLWLADATDSFGQTGVRDASGRSGRQAGTQLEWRGRVWLKPKVIRLSAGAAYLAKGRFLRTAPNAPATGDTRYGYLELVFTP